MLISFLIKGTQRNHTISESQELSKTQTRELKSSKKEDIGRKMILRIKGFLIIGKINLLIHLTKNVGLMEK